VVSLLLAQLVAFVVLLRRLLPGRLRPPPVVPRVDGLTDTTVSVVVPARNEALRIGPCLAGLRAQGPPLLEAIVVDGASTDATPQLVEAASALDPRIRRLAEPPRPAGAVGRPWAIAAGCAAARGEWIMVVDADAAPKPGMVAGAVAAARECGFPALSFAPHIMAPTSGAELLQPAFLATLVYRFGAVGIEPRNPERVMANGQCLLLHRATLERAGGYAAATDSYCDDVRIVRHLAAHGVRVGFLDGAQLFDVTMYPTARETWRAWPQSLNMRDTTTARWTHLDVLFLLLAQMAPLPALLALAVFARSDGAAEVQPVLLGALASVNAAFVGVRVLLSVAMAHSFAHRGVAYWLSPAVDPAVALRVIQTMLRRPREWRGGPRGAG